MKNQHSAGPWSIRPCGTGYSILRADDWSIAQVFDRAGHPTRGGEVTSAECEANARMIAMAPKMVEALRKARHALRYDLSNEDRAIARGACEDALTFAGFTE